MVATRTCPRDIQYTKVSDNMHNVIHPISSIIFLWCHEPIPTNGILLFLNSFFDLNFTDKFLTFLTTIFNGKCKLVCNMGNSSP